MSQPEIVLEILSGPFDGDKVTLHSSTSWSKTGTGALIFPWDNELGTPQARFFPEAGNWYLESYDTPPHGTYCDSNQRGAIRGKIPLEDCQKLKASQTWLSVRQIK